jgi:hypothetical protein
MSARYIKIITWVAALLCAWELGRSYAVSDAIFLFAADGVIPGTNKTLSPNQVFWFIGTFLAAALLLIFASNIYRVLLFLFGRRPAASETEVSLQGVVATKAKKTKTNATKPVVIVEMHKRTGWTVHAIHRTVLVLFILFAAVGAIIRTHFPRMAAMAVGIWWKFDQLARVIGQYTLPHLRRARHAVYVISIKLAILVGRQAVHFWRWLEPYLQTFDAWLGVQYRRGVAAARKNETFKAIAKLTRETDKVVANWRAEIRAVLNRVVEK